MRAVPCSIARTCVTALPRSPLLSRNPRKPARCWPVDASEDITVGVTLRPLSPSLFSVSFLFVFPTEKEPVCRAAHTSLSEALLTPPPVHPILTREPGVSTDGACERGSRSRSHLRDSEAAFEHPTLPTGTHVPALGEPPGPVQGGCRKGPAGTDTPHRHESTSSGVTSRSA